MNVVDLHPQHPEELIDKLASGTLAADERERLRAHLQSCSACRFEISVRGNLADEAMLPAAKPRAPLAMPSVLLDGRTAGEGSGRRSRWPAKRALLLPLLAAALVAGGALAAVVSEVVRARHAEEMVLQERGAHAKADAQRAIPGARAIEAVEDPPAPEAASPQVQAPPEPQAVAEEPAPGKHPRTLAAGKRASTGVAANGPPAPRTEPASASFADPSPTQAAHTDDPPPRTAEALFGAANRARRYGKVERALSLYRSLQEQFPNSEEARLSRATVAALQLDRGEAGAALDGFDRYIAQGGSALSVEALVGRAEALQRLGRTTAELASWREIARRFPGTVHARRAAARIAILGQER
jgi:TolA-binding protein